VVVSDDSSVADRRSEATCAGHPGVRYQRGPRRGLGANRNAALSLVGSADWVHFIDDDVVVPADFYGHAVDACRALAGSALISGQELRHDPASGTVPSVVIPPRATFWAHLSPPGAEGGNCVVINAALFPRSLFVRAAFDERLRYGCEEIDISREAEHLGYRLVFVPTLKVDHYPSAVNRATYQTVAFASVVYSGLKHHWFRRRRPLAALAFAAIAVPRMYLNNIRRGGVAVLPSLLRQTRTAVAYLVDFRNGRLERVGYHR
jgi:GT2 family glycosyltransferase